VRTAQRHASFFAEVTLNKNLAKKLTWFFFFSQGKNSNRALHRFQDHIVSLLNRASLKDIISTRTEVILDEWLLSSVRQRALVVFAW